MKNVLGSLVPVLILAALSCSKSSDDTSGAAGNSPGGSSAGSGGATSSSSAGGSALGGAASGSAGSGATAGGSVVATGGGSSGGASTAGAGGNTSSAGAAGSVSGNAGAAGNTSGSAGAAGSLSGSAGAAGGGTLPSACNGSVHSTGSAGSAQPSVALTVPTGFTLTTIAKVTGARELAALPNGDLLIATSGGSIYLLPNADASTAVGSPAVFGTVTDTPAQGIAFDPSTCKVYVGSQKNLYSLAYTDAQKTGSFGTAIASVRTGSISPNRPAGDTDNHTTTSVAVASGVLYAGVGSSCNACVETDATRASIQRFDLNGANGATRATRFRNAIALTANPATGTLWAGGAGQDNLPANHPYEFFDAVGLHSGVADYGWPACEENHVAYTSGAACADTVQPLIELPAYSTIIGAAFYPATQAGAYAFPATYKGGLFLTAHGSWHKDTGGALVSKPQVVYVPMNGDAPKTAVDWSDPTKQWTTFVGGFQLADGATRLARPTGIAVGALGSLLIADDQSGYIFRVRPN